jgi:hypothetical protein
MNLLNYGSPEACQKLYAKGIVLETDAIWVLDWKANIWMLMDLHEKVENWRSCDCIPAPSMAEVWRELPEEFSEFELYKDGNDTRINVQRPPFLQITNTNPTDALIDLLIFTKSLDKPKST